MTHSHDPHEIRHHGASETARMLDQLDDEALALVPPAADALTALAGRLQANGMSHRHIISNLMGIVLGVCIEDE